MTKIFPDPEIEDLRMIKDLRLPTTDRKRCHKLENIPMIVRLRKTSRIARKANSTDLAHDLLQRRKSSLNPALDRSFLPN